MLPPGRTYDEVYTAFRWQIPEYYNIGVDICDKWAGQRYRLALIYESDRGEVEKYTFWELKRLSNRLANGLTAAGIQPGDRVGILLPQSPETALSHIAVYKIGAVALPLFTLFGTDALQYRLANSEARAVITDGVNLPKVLEIREKLPELQVVVVCRGENTGEALDFQALVDQGSPAFTPARTPGRRSGPDHLHLRHHRPAQGGAARPSGAARASAGVRVPPQLLSRRRRPLLDPGRLGLDRRPDRRAAAELALRDPGAGPPGAQVRSRGSASA